MKKLLKISLLLFAAFLYSSSVLGQVMAANLKFDVPSISTTADDTFQVQIKVDTGGEEINGVDAYIDYDKEIVKPESVTAGTFLPTVIPELSSDRAYVAALVDDPATSKSGTGTIATINFKALKAGTTTLTFYCSPDVNDSSKVVKSDFDSTNIIECSENGSTSVTVTGESDTVTIDEDSDGDVEEVATGGVDELPESGVFENVLKFAAPGALLFIIGLAIKMLL